MSDKAHEDILISVKMIIEKEIDNYVHDKLSRQSELIHTHPPLRFIVEDCPFCQKFGNIFALPL